MIKTGIELSEKKMIHMWFFLLIFCQTITMFPIIVISKSTNLHWHHIVTLTGIVPFLCGFRKKIRIPKTMFTGLYLYAIGLSLVDMIFFGIGSRMINMVYALIIYILVYNFSLYFDEKSLSQIMCMAGLLYGILVTINIVLHAATVFDCLLGKIEHPRMSTIIGGGINLEATYLGFFSIFMIKQKKYWYWFFAVLVSVAYGSRAGMLVDAIAIGLVFFQLIRKPSDKKWIHARRLILFCVILLIIIVGKQIKVGVFTRITKIGEDVGSIARLKMWQMVPQVVSQNPFGYGFGNGINVVRRAAGIFFEEDNLHNVYLQYLVELGIPGFILWILIMLKVIRAAWQSNFQNEVSNLLLLFYATFLVQSVGTEPLFFAMMAFLDAMKSRKVKTDILKVFPKSIVYKKAYNRS